MEHTSSIQGIVCVSQNRNHHEILRHSLAVVTRSLAQSFRLHERIVRKQERPPQYAPRTTRLLRRIPLTMSDVCIEALEHRQVTRKWTQEL